MATTPPQRVSKYPKARHPKTAPTVSMPFYRDSIETKDSILTTLS